MIALQILIWFLPFSFVNSVTQYVLIAIDQQRFLTKAFLIGVTFNIVANLLVIPVYSYKGAAVVTILSELALLIPFYYAVRKHLGPLPWLSLFWQPTVASAVMAAVMWLLQRSALAAADPGGRCRVPGRPGPRWRLSPARHGSAGSPASARSPTCAPAGGANCGLSSCCICRIWG